VLPRRTLPRTLSTLRRQHLRHLHTRGSAAWVTLPAVAAMNQTTAHTCRPQARLWSRLVHRSPSGACTFAPVPLVLHASGLAGSASFRARSQQKPDSPRLCPRPARRPQIPMAPMPPGDFSLGASASAALSGRGAVPDVPVLSWPVQPTLVPVPIVCTCPLRAARPCCGRGTQRFVSGTRVARVGALARCSHIGAVADCVEL